MGLIVKGDSQIRTLKEFVEYSRQNPGKVTIGTPGAGTKTSLVLNLVTPRTRSSGMRSSGF